LVRVTDREARLMMKLKYKLKSTKHGWYLMKEGWMG